MNHAPVCLVADPTDSLVLLVLTPSPSGPALPLLGRLVLSEVSIHAMPVAPRERAIIQHAGIYSVRGPDGLARGEFMADAQGLAEAVHELACGCHGGVA